MDGAANQLLDIIPEKAVGGPITETKADHSTSYRPDIDGLRAVAILVVVLYHLDKTWVPGGFLGVDIFFVISGFVVTSSLAQYSSSSSSGAGFVAFYARRAKRLMPASLFMISLAGLLMTVFVVPWSSHLEQYFFSAQFALLSGSNNYFASLRASYFSSGVASLEGNPFTHTWSLGVEEQFYFAFPFVLMVAYGQSLQMSPQVGHRFNLRALLVLSVVAATSMLAAWILQHSGHDQETVAFYILPSRLWELASGALLFEVQSSCADVSSGVRPWVKQMASITLQFSALLLMGSSVILSPHGSPGTIPVVLPAVCGAMCFISAGRLPLAYFNDCLSHSPVVYLGKISYPLYLFHWPVFVLCTGSFGLASLQNKLACLGISMALAVFTYHVVESPFRKWHPTRNWTVMAAMGAGILLVELWLVALNGPLHGKFWIFAADFPAQPHAAPWGGHAFASAGAAHGSSGCGCRLADTTWHSPPCAMVGPDAEAFAPCFVEVPIRTKLLCDPWTCQTKGHKITEQATSTQGSKPNTFYLLGDSHANHMVPAVKLAVDGRLNVQNLGKGGCFYGPWPPGSNQNDMKECQAHHELVTAQLVDKLVPGDIVAVSNSATRFHSDRDSLIAYKIAYKTFENWIAAYKTALESLHTKVSARGGKMMIFGFSPTYVYISGGNDCIPTYFKPDAASKCEKPLETSRMKTKAVMQALATLPPAVVVFNHHDLFCDDRVCGAFVPGTKTLAFADSSHFTDAAQRYLAPYLCSFLSSHDMLPSKAVSDKEVKSKDGKRSSVRAMQSKTRLRGHEAHRGLRHSSGKLTVSLLQTEFHIEPGRSGSIMHKKAEL